MANPVRFPTGTATDDILFSGNGNETLDGGGGHDVAVFRGTSHDYRLTISHEGLLRIEDLRTSGDRDGVDVLKDIEEIRFSEGPSWFVSMDAVAMPDRANTHVLHDQGSPHTAPLADGGFVVVWTSNMQDGSGFGAYAQRYSAIGERAGEEFRVHQETSLDQSVADVVTLANGDFVVCWQTNDSQGSASDVYAQRFSSAGTAQGARIHIDATTVAQSFAGDMIATSDGGFLVAWQTFSGGFQTHLQRFNAQGEKAGAQVSIGTANGGTLSQPQLVDLGQDGFVVVWNWLAFSGGGRGIAAQRFSSDGEALGSTFFPGAPSSASASLADVIRVGAETFLVSWSTGSGIQARVFGNDGNARSEAFRVDDGSGNVAFPASFVSIGDDEFVAIWARYGADGNPGSLAGQRVDSTGTKLAAPFAIDTGGVHDPSQVAATLLGNGDIAVTWRSANQDGSGGGIYSQVIDTHGTTKALRISVSADASHPDLAGTLLGDDISGDDRANRLDGKDGNDTLRGNGGDDTLNGGAGEDTAYFAMPADGLVITVEQQNDSASAHVVVSSAAQSTHLAGIERLQFGDGTAIELRMPVSTVNPSGMWEQFAPALARLDNGDVLVVWQALYQDGNGSGIFAQRLDHEGHPLGTATRVNTWTSNEQASPAVASLADGGFVVVWQSLGQDGSSWGIFAQHFDADAVPRGTELQISSHSAGQQWMPDAVALADGGFVAVWQSSQQDGSQHGIYAQRVDANGNLTGDEFRINSTTASDQSRPAIMALADGDFVVAWQSRLQDGDGYGIIARRFGADGSARSGEVLVNSPATGDQTNPAIVALADGSYVIAWESADADGTGILAQRFDAAGAAVGGTLQLNEGVAGDQQLPALLALANGDWVAAWYSGADAHLVGRRFSSDGSPLGDELLVASSATDNFSPPSLLAMDDGYLLSWTAPGDGDGEFDVFVQKRDASHALQAHITLGTHAGSGVGTSGDDAVTGNALDNTFADTSGRDTIDGADGIDHMHFQGDYGNYALRWDEDGRIHATQRATGSPQETDVLVHIENLHFADGTHVSVTRHMETLMEPPLAGSGFGLNSATLKNGGTVDVWTSTHLAPGQGSDVFMRLVHADGTVSAGALANTFKDSDQGGAQVAALPDGGFLVVWHSAGQDGSFYGIFAQRFLADGSRDGAEHQVNSWTASGQYRPQVAVLADGGHVIAWESFAQDPDGSGGVYAQRFDARGAASGGEFRLNAYTAHEQSQVTLTALRDGGFLATWASDRQDGGGAGIYARRFAGDGNAVGGEFRVNTTTAGHQAGASAVALEDGGFVIVWNGPAAGGAGIFGQRYNADGSSSGDEIRVDATAALGKSGAKVIQTTQGDLVIAWTSLEQDGDEAGVYARRLVADGTAAGPEFRVNTGTQGVQTLQGLTALDDGGVLVRWASRPHDSDVMSYYAQRYAADGVPAGTVEITLGSSVESGSGSARADILRGNARNNLLDGGEGADSVIGAEGSDRLSGGDSVSRDTLVGGPGNDIYLLSAGVVDLVVEHAGGGLDSVRTSAAYTLAPHLERLVLTTATGTRLAGNELANTIKGNQGDDALLGADGDDLLDAGAGQDALHGGAGSDTLLGGDGADQLDGGEGDDVMTGGRGDDRYVVSSAGDVIRENPGAGSDTVASAINWTLSRNTEHLELTADARNGIGNDAANQMSGNALANRLKGGGGADTLQGGAGHDTLYGGAGSDLLYGGEGNDRFVFDSALNGSSNVDRIADFQSGSDRLLLSSAIFQSLSAGSLDSDALAFGTRARDAATRIIQDPDTGAVYYDADGNGPQYKVKFAELELGVLLSLGDCMVI